MVGAGTTLKRIRQAIGIIININTILYVYIQVLKK